MMALVTYVLMIMTMTMFPITWTTAPTTPKSSLQILGIK